MYLSFLHLLLNNKKAYHQYEIIERYTAGIQLKGSEVKSLRNSKGSLSEAFCQVKSNEVFIIGMHIAEYKNIQHTNHEPYRIRKLLLTKKEIQKIQKKINEKGMTLVPLSVFLSENGFIKIEIALAKGKKIYDKREAIKKKDAEREVNRNNSTFNN